jgi:hypothetical protein
MLDGGSGKSFTSVCSYEGLAHRVCIYKSFYEKLAKKFSFGITFTAKES